METVPAAVNNYLGPIPKLGRVAHPRLRQLVFVDLWLEPVLLFRVKDENIVYYPLFAVAFSAAKNEEVLAELGGAMAVASRRRAPLDLINGQTFIHFNELDLP